MTLVENNINDIKNIKEQENTTQMIKEIKDGNS